MAATKTFFIQPRKWLTHQEVIVADGAHICPRPITRVVAMDVFENVLTEGNADQGLVPLIDASKEIGEELARRALEALDQPVIAYGKAAIVGTDGEIEHAAAVLHPKLGAPMRSAIGGGKALIPSTSKVAHAGASVDVPLGSKDDPWSFDEIDTITVTVVDAPRPQEILLAVAFSDGGRPNPRLPK